MQDGLRQENGTAVLLVCVVSRVAQGARFVGVVGYKHLGEVNIVCRFCV
jgi:hypothetical protein